MKKVILVALLFISVNVFAQKRHRKKNVEIKTDTAKAILLISNLIIDKRDPETGTAYWIPGYKVQNADNSTVFLDNNKIMLPKNFIVWSYRLY